MVDRLKVKPTTLTRTELEAIFKTPKAIKAFEDLQRTIGFEYVALVNGILDSIDTIDAAPPPAESGVAEALQQAAFSLEAVSSQLSAVREELAAVRSTIDNLQEGPP